jgi:hypothetical protein
LNEKIENLEKKFAGKFNEIGTKVNDIEKNTLWKIKDCEELLKNRVSERYVNDAIEKIQESIQLDVNEKYLSNHHRLEGFMMVMEKKLILYLKKQCQRFFIMSLT